MRIAIDTSPVYTGNAGVACYVRGLLHGFDQLQDHQLEISSLAWEEANIEYKQPGRAMKTLYRELLWNKFAAPRILRSRKVDLFHTTQLAPIRHPEKTIHVHTLHDCAVLRFPERFRRWHKISSRLYLKKVGSADKIICISRFTADEAIRFLDIPADKLEVIYLGNRFKDTSIVPLKPEVDIPDKFLLFIGSLEPGKNLQLLSRTYHLADEQHLEIPPLVIVGTRWKGVKKEAPHPRWIYLGHQPDSALAYLYRNASVLLFPSQYEGFGLPILEAMSFGCPVLCSKVTSIPEVAGDAAIYAMHSPEDYLHKISALMDDNTLLAHLGRASRQQAAKFSWRLCSSQTRDVYMEML